MKHSVGGRSTRQFVLVAVVACLMPVASMQAQQCAARTYVMLAEGDTVVIETIEQVGSSLTGTLSYRDQKTYMELRATPEPDAGWKVETAIWPNTLVRVGEPAQQGTVWLRGKVMNAEVSATGHGSQTQVAAIEPGSIPYMDNMALFLELMTRRVVATSPAPATIPVAWLFTRGRSDHVGVERLSAGSLKFTWPELVIEVDHDATGALVATRRSDDTSIAMAPATCE